MAANRKSRVSDVLREQQLSQQAWGHLTPAPLQSPLFKEPVPQLAFHHTCLFKIFVLDTGEVQTREESSGAQGARMAL